MLYTINRKYLIVIDLLELSYRNAIYIDIKHRLSTQVLEHIYFLYKRTWSIFFVSEWSCNVWSRGMIFEEMDEKRPLTFFINILTWMTFFYMNQNSKSTLRRWDPRLESSIQIGMHANKQTNKLIQALYPLHNAHSHVRFSKTNMQISWVL